jgi:GMP synthase (glutamine-hydrolysing)
MDKIAVLDFGGQYAHLIANRVRRLNVYSEIVDGETPAEKLKEYKGIILSGGPESVYDNDSVKCDPGILDLGVPLFGICYGHQLLAHIQGAEVKHAPEMKEFGLAEIDVKKAEGLFKDLKPKETVWMSHGDTVTELPDGYEVIGSTKSGEWAAIANFEKHFYGIQFHFEVTHTKSGMKMLENFLDLCGVGKDWMIDDYIKERVDSIKECVGDKKVFMLVSGGVDSTVAFALLDKALGEDRVYGLFVDTGFLRQDERGQVEESLKWIGLTNLHVVDAGERYFKALKNIYDPEAKRKIIGDLFLEVQQDKVDELNLNPDEWLLGQGTIYPDTIESGGTKHAAKIKTHHNRVPQIEELIRQGKIIEPISQLYKDEVRKVGELLGLSEDMVWRHPFPGPGLAVRCLCAHDEIYPHNYRLLEDKADEYLKEYGLEAWLLPIQSVGVQGDFRTYRNPLAILGNADFNKLDELATELVNQNDDINRVVKLVEPRNIETLEVQNVYLTPERIKLLQKADAVTNDFINRYGLKREIWQFPTVLIPLSVNSEIGESIVLRPVESEEAMTANFYHMDQNILNELGAELMKLKGITGVFFDVTNKPPGTIEWE